MAMNRFGCAHYKDIELEIEALELLVYHVEALVYLCFQALEAFINHVEACIHLLFQALEPLLEQFPRHQFLAQIVPHFVHDLPLLLHDGGVGPLVDALDRTLQGAGKGFDKLNPRTSAFSFSPRASTSNS